MHLIKTERTLLRPFTFEDSHALFKLNQDPDVLKFTGDVPFVSLEEVIYFIEHYYSTQPSGLGRMAVIDKTTDQFLGWCGLKYKSELNEYDLGFRFFKSYWGQGFATEVSLACLDYGFQHFNLPAIVGRAMEQNAASIRVLQKIGMHFSKCIFEKGVAWQVYEITRKK